MNLKSRTKAFIEQLGLPISRFCKLAKISTAAYYKWQNDEIRLTEETQNRIKSVLERFNG